MKPFLCKVGIHKWGKATCTSWGFKSNVLDCKKKCLRCGKVKSWVKPKRD